MQLYANPRCWNIVRALLEQVAKQVSKADGLKKLLVAENDAFDGLLPERLAPVVLASCKQFQFTHVVGASTAFCKVSQALLQ